MTVLRPYLIFFLLTLLSMEPVWAVEKEKADSWERQAIDGNIAVSEFFDGLAERLDLLLAGKRTTRRANESKFQIENTADSTEGEGVSNSTSVGVHLRLPNLEEYWKLKFSTYDEQEENRSARNAQFARTTRRKNPGATVGWLQNLGKLRVAFQPRIEFKDPLRVSQSLAFYRVIETRSFFLVPRFELFANPEKGTGVANALNLSFELPRGLGLALLNDSQYAEKAHTFSVNNGFSIGRAVTQRSSLATSLIFSSDNRPNYHLAGYSWAVSWSHTLYKRILDYQLIPHLDFAKVNEFKGRAGVTLSVVLNF